MLFITLTKNIRMRNSLSLMLDSLMVLVSSLSYLPLWTSLIVSTSLDFSDATYALSSAILKWNNDWVIFVMFCCCWRVRKMYGFTVAVSWMLISKKSVPLRLLTLIFIWLVGWIRRMVLLTRRIGRVLKEILSALISILLLYIINL